MQIRNYIRQLIVVAMSLLLWPCETQLSAQNFTILGPEEALQLEHSTRYKRLTRLAGETGISEPQFRDYVIPREFMPRNFPYDIPVLRIIFPENTFFDTGRHEIKASAIPIIQTMAQMLDGDVPDVSVFIAGHADNRGDSAYNLNLSIRRARAVADLLSREKRRVDDPVWSIGFGESVPLYPNTSDENMSYNRRVEFLLAARRDAVEYWLQDQVVDVCRSEEPQSRLRCMTDFKRTPKIEFVAERSRVRAEKPKPISVQDERPSPPIKTKTGEGKVTVQSAGSDRIIIKLNEKRVRVRAVEH